MRVFKRLLALTVSSTAVLLLFTSHALAGGVLPSAAHPRGWSLERMTSALALFTTSGNQPAYYPDTPFQLLYVDPGTGSSVSVDDGVKFFGSNTFTVRPGTEFFLPLWNVDDSPPIVGTWPQTQRDVVPYFFGPSQVGAKGFAITIDGAATPIGPPYLAGPVTSPVALLDGGGTQIMTLGAFLSPLPPGRHRVTITGGLYGAGIANTYSIGFLEEEIAYTVTVAP